MEEYSTKKSEYDLCTLELLNRILEAEKYYTKKEYVIIVGLARELFERGIFDLCERELDKLPSSAQLLDSLVEKLKGKSVYKTLRRIQEGTAEDILVTAKGLSSLLTHTIIECEQGNFEYKVLMMNIIEKLNEIVYNILRNEGKI